MSPTPIPPPERDPFEGLVLDQAFVRAAAIREDRLPSRRRGRVTTAPDADGLAVVRARIAGSAAPELTRRSLTLSALATLTLVAAIAVVGPGWQMVSSAFGGDDKPAVRTSQGDGGSWLPTVTVTPQPTGGVDAAGAASDGAVDAAGGASVDVATPGPVLVDGNLVDPFRDPFEVR